MRSSDSVQQRTFLLLRSQIINMELLPGTAMSAYELSKKLAVSRTPVREAFIRLASESLVDILPQRSTRVSRIDFERVRQERFLREALELSAMLVFLERAGDEQLCAMRALLALQRDAVRRRNPVDVLKYDDQFHKIVFDAAGQPLSWGVIERMSGHYRRVRLMMVAEHGEADGIVDEHERLIDAFAARDERQAIARTEAHLRKINLQERALRGAHPNFFVPVEG